MSLSEVRVNPQGAREVFHKIAANIARVMRGQAGSTRKLLAALASGGHVLLEGFPGTGKTTLAKALARSIDAQFKRIQFTPDLLPSDILGVSIFSQRDQQFHFHEGPVFTNILLADEINRASPRTQSALLEAMGESQVSVDGTRRDLAELFFVIATQNPVEFRGTYPLPDVSRIVTAWLKAKAASRFACRRAPRCVPGNSKLHSGPVLANFTTADLMRKSLYAGAMP